MLRQGSRLFHLARFHGHADASMGQNSAALPFLRQALLRADDRRCYATVATIHRSARASTDVDVLGARKLPTGQRRARPIRRGGCPPGPETRRKRGEESAEKKNEGALGRHFRHFRPLKIEDFPEVSGEHAHRLMSTFLGRGNSRPASCGAHSTRRVPSGPGDAEQTRRRPKVRTGRRGSRVSGELRFTVEPPRRRASSFREPETGVRGCLDAETRRRGGRPRESKCLLCELLRVFAPPRQPFGLGWRCLERREETGGRQEKT